MNHPLSTQQRILDIVDAKPRVEIGQINQVARLFHVGKMDLLIDVMGAKPAALLAEVFVWSTLRRDRQRK